MSAWTAIREWEFSVELLKVREFCISVYDDYARANPPAPPPTFPVCATADYVTQLIFEELKLDRSRTVHGEHEYEYFRPLRVGDRLICRARLSEDFVKPGRRGGQMRFIITETEMRDAESGELVVRERSTSIETASSEALIP
ncbi:MAG: MaoC family dehydratase N-terminal domain-containing protein [Steroidobacteraceae bacterium]